VAADCIRPAKIETTMSQSQLDLLPPDQAAILIRKKRFWKRTMWISLVITPIFMATTAICHSMAMERIFQTIAELDSGSAGGNEYSVSEIRTIVLITRIAFAISSGGILLFLVSLIRCLSLPKIPKASNSGSISQPHP
jgi:hypothetical protein